MVVAGIALVLVLFAGWFLFSLFQPFKGDGDGRVRVTIPTGATVARSATCSRRTASIDSAFFFRARARSAATAATSSRAPTTCKKDMSYCDVIDALAKGPPKNIVKVRSRRAGRAREIAPIVEQAGLKGSYERASVSSPGFNPRSTARSGAENLEGFLFPATYELKRGGERRRAGRQAARGVQATVRQGRPAQGEAQEPDPVRRADHRVDGRARGQRRRRSAR